MVQQHSQANEGVGELEDTSAEIIKAKNKKSSMKKNDAEFQKPKEYRHTYQLCVMKVSKKRRSKKE